MNEDSVRGCGACRKLHIVETVSGYSAYEVAVINGFVGTEKEWLASLKGEKGAGIIDHTVIADTAWTGDAAPYTQEIAVPGLPADVQIIVGLAANITAEQYAAALTAQLLCTAQAADSITLTAFGEAPTVAIPILVRVVA